MSKHDDDTMRAVLDTAERFADRELVEPVHDRDKYPYGAYAAEVMAKAHAAGLLDLSAPEAEGGAGLPPGAWALVIEKLAVADAGIAASVLAHALAAEAVRRAGRGALISGTEPGPSLLAYPIYLQADDPQGLPAAQTDADGFILSGAAAMVANAPVAAAAVVAAQMEDNETGLFLVPLSDEIRPAPIEMLGLRSCPVGDIGFPDLKLGLDHLLARGPKMLLDLHDRFYPSAAAILLAGLKASLDYAIEYGRERYQGGRMIAEHSQLRTMYGRMAVEHRVLREAWLRSLEDGDGQARIAVKIAAADLAIRGTTDGVQLLGGYGYTMEYPQERRMRDSRQAAEILGSPARLRLALIDELLSR